MPEQRTAVAAAVGALILGIAGDVLLRYVPWGLNAVLWTVLFLVAAFWCCGRRRPSLLVVAGALVAAAGIAWRDCEVLVALDVVLLAVFLPMLALGAREIRVAAAGLSHIALGLLTTGAQAVAGFPRLVFRDLEWRPMPALRAGGVVLRGVVLAVPALLIFGALFVSADADFAAALENLLNVRELFLHLLVTAVIAAVCAGFLRSMAFGGPSVSLTRPGWLKLPAAETNIALGLVGLLFASFVLVQFQHFFGTSGRIAQDARRGFFELVWVVALTLPMLLILEWLIDKTRVALFRALALVQIALVFVIAYSAWWRMELYRDEFGLTRLRLFTTAFMLWLAALLVWFAVTVLTGRRNRFAVGALATGVAAVVILHAINPDALIVRTNLAREAAGRRTFDSGYARSLSDDAVPLLVADGRLAESLRPPRPMGWRTWNWSRARAEEALRTIERPPPRRAPF